MTGINASEIIVQKISARAYTGVVHQLTKVANFIATPMKKNI